MKRYRVSYEMDEAGYWLAMVAGVPGCHTQGRSLESARARVREALAASVGSGARAVLLESYRLAPVARDVTRRARAAMSRAEHAHSEAQRQLRSAVRRLLAARLSHRDAAVVLGLSHQRVAQLAQEGRSRGRPGTERPVRRRARRALPRPGTR